METSLSIPYPCRKCGNCSKSNAGIGPSGQIVTPDGLSTVTAACTSGITLHRLAIGMNRQDPLYVDLL